MIKPFTVKNFGKVLNHMEKHGIFISKLKMRWLTKPQAEQFYAEHKGKSFYENLTTHMSSGPVIGMELVG